MERDEAENTENTEDRGQSGAGRKEPPKSLEKETNYSNVYSSENLLWKAMKQRQMTE